MHSSALALGLFAIGAIGSLSAQSPWGVHQKPHRTTFHPEVHSSRVLSVKFRDGLHVEADQGRLIHGKDWDLVEARPLLDALDAGYWKRSQQLPIETIDRMRKRAESYFGQSVPDLNLHFFLLLPPEFEVATVLDQFLALDCVEWALPVSIDVDPPSPSSCLSGPNSLSMAPPPDLTPNQTYLQPVSPGGGGGIGASAVWTAHAGGTGANVGICDVEGSFNAGHLDLSPVTIIASNAACPNSHPSNAVCGIEHGTHTLGMLGAKADGIGMTGICPDSPLSFVTIATGIDLQSTPPVLFFDTANAIITAADSLSPGDVLLIERQVLDPNTGAFGPEELDPASRTAILMAVASEIVVVEAAGNSGLSLDSHLNWPSTGAIIVGAAANTSGATPTTRASFSNYGSRLDLHGFGEDVHTLGSNGLYSSTSYVPYWPQAMNYEYTANYAGTSSASAMVAGAVALLNSVYEERSGGLRLQPSQSRDILVASGVAQPTGQAFNANIGPRPDVPSAIAVLPTITSLTPSSIVAGAPPQSVTVSGSGFAPSATVSWDGVPLATTFVSPSVLTVVVPAAYLAAKSNAIVRVETTIPQTTGTLITNGSTFRVRPPSMGPCADNNLPLLMVNGTTGGSARRVDVLPSSSFSVAIDSAAPGGTAFAIFVAVGHPNSSPWFSASPIQGTACFTPCAIDGTNPNVFDLTNDLVPICPPLYPSTGPAPWATIIPPLDQTTELIVQALTQIPGQPGLAFTDAILINLQP